MSLDRPLVLIVDDDEDSRYVYGKLLSHRGFEVIEADTALLGIGLARTLGPAAIVMDYLLPDMTGWEATRQLKADDATRAIPIIALTAHAMAGDQERALDAGCDDYDTKPVELPRLLGKIDALLARKSPS
jgi:two-component system cell cycle response regulator DivK